MAPFGPLIHRAHALTKPAVRGLPHGRCPGGEAQRLKLATELGREQSGTLFVLDEPSIGLHPLDTRVLIDVLDRLLAEGATIVIIDHDLIANADHIIDIGPGGITRVAASLPPAPCRRHWKSGQRHRPIPQRPPALISDEESGHPPVLTESSRELPRSLVFSGNQTVRYIRFYPAPAGRSRMIVMGKR